MKALLILGAMFFSQGMAATAPCFQYNVRGVELTGIVTLKTFFGPPGYGETPNLDRKEVQGLLTLDQPLCVAALGENKPEEQGQKVVTLVPLGKFSLRPFAGKHVVVSGNLFHAFTAHHHTNVLISLEQPPRISR